MRSLLPLICLACISTTAVAQSSWTGFLDGVHPVHVVLNGDGITGTLTTSERPTTPYELVGTCQGQDCALRARQAALGMKTKAISSDQLQMTVTNGEGIERSARLSQVKMNDATAGLAASCTKGGTVVTYIDSDDRLMLVLAALVGGQLRGTAHVRSLNTSLQVSGESIAGSHELVLRDAAGARVGRITTADICYQKEVDATLTLEGGVSQLRLVQKESIELACQSAAGRYDMVYPQLEQSGGAYAKQVSTWWTSVQGSSAGGASMWFVPSRLDERVLSGWMMMKSGAFAKTEAVTLDRQSGKLLKSTALLGPKKSRSSRVHEAQQQASKRHPLHADQDFQSWASDAVFDQAAVLAEGLSFSGPYHPLYGQLSYTLAWDELGYTKKLPSWITLSSNSAE